MHDQLTGNGVAWWAARDAQALALIVDDIMREEAWWIAVRSGKYAYGATVWVDRADARAAGPDDWPRPEPWKDDAYDRVDEL